MSSLLSVEIAVSLPDWQQQIHKKFMTIDADAVKTNKQ